MSGDGATIQSLDSTENKVAPVVTSSTPAATAPEAEPAGPAPGAAGASAATGDTTQEAADKVVAMPSELGGESKQGLGTGAGKRMGAGAQRMKRKSSMGRMATSMRRRMPSAQNIIQSIKSKTSSFGVFGIGKTHRVNMRMAPVRKGTMGEDRGQSDLKIARLNLDRLDEYEANGGRQGKAPTASQALWLARIEHPGTEWAMMALTIFALYGTDANQIRGGPDFDNTFGWLSFITMLIFLAELGIASYCKIGYLGNSFFWLDLLAAVSLVGDVPWLAKFLFPSGFAAARLGRASRAGTRAGRLVRVIRLIRLTRFLKLLGKKKGEGDDGNDTGGENAGAMTNQMTLLTTVKVIVGLLLMLLVSPFLEPRNENLSKLNGLTHLKELEEALVTRDGACGVNGGAEGCYNVTAVMAVAGTGYWDTYDNVLFLKAAGLTLRSDDAQIDALRPTELELVMVSDKDYDTMDTARERERYIAVFDAEGQRDLEAEFSMYTTTFIIFLLGLGIFFFRRDAKLIASDITEPLALVSKEMDKVSKMEIEDTRAFLATSKVYEIRQMQQATMALKNGIASFSKFIPHEVVKSMLKSGQEAILQVTMRTVTSFFSDIAGFTTICEQVPPGPLVQLLTEYFDYMSPRVIESGGSLLDFVGDAVFAVWNAPGSVPEHGRICVEQALLMQADLDRARPEWCDRNYPPLHIRIGIHTAPVFVGNIGGTERMKYSVLGDGVAMCERLEDGNKKYSGRCMITQDTLDEPNVKGRFLMRLVDFIGVKGRDSAMPLWQIVCKTDEATEEKTKRCELHTKAIRCYESRDFTQAMALLEEVSALPMEKYMLQQYDGVDKAITCLMKRCKRLAAHPPPTNWDIGGEGAI